VHLVSQGDTSFDPSQPAVPAAIVPAAPASATAITSAMLVADVAISGDAVVNGVVACGGTDAARRITVTGDLYLAGTLEAADLGTARQEIDLQVSGTIYLSGVLDAGGGAEPEAGGAVHLSADQVRVTGQIVSAGGASHPAGAIGIQATRTITMTGTIDASGGNAAGGGAGAAANLTLQAGGDIGVAGVVRLRGGVDGGAAGWGTGGPAATLAIDSNAAVTVGGIVDLRGGGASGTGATAGGQITGGAAGALRIGENAQPTTVTLLVPLVATGGAGDAQAGAGGTVTPEPGTGNVTIAGPRAIDLSGGNSMAVPGAGGLLNGGPRTDPGSGSVHITGDIVASGGSIVSGGTGNGADGGRVDMELTPTDGAVAIDPSATITVEGGASGGTGTAGGGGHVWFFTKDGDATIAGTISVNGGDAPDPGGVGGLGGMIYFFTDNNFNATEAAKGNLEVTTTGLLESSGGNGTVGGSARNNGTPDSVPSFPDKQEQIAIFLNCDGAHGNTLNWMENDGLLMATGGVHDGNGGDIVYHGIPPGALVNGDPGGDIPVPSGNIRNAGDGTGAPGDFDGE
jgi:hypothetical protein